MFKLDERLQNDTVLVTEDGNVNLTPVPDSLEDMVLAI